MERSLHAGAGTVAQRCHGPYVHRTGVPATALEWVEDAVQQARLKLVQNWERVSALPWGETEGYVATVVKNAALDILIDCWKSQKNSF